MTYSAISSQSNLRILACSSIHCSLPAICYTEKWIPAKRIRKASHHLPHVFMVCSKRIAERDIPHSQGVYSNGFKTALKFLNPLFKIILYGSLSIFFILMGPFCSSFFPLLWLGALVLSPQMPSLLSCVLDRLSMLHFLFPQLF